MTLASQWKDPKKRNRNLMLGLAIGLVVCFGFYNCWWGGQSPVVYDFNWCPGSCFPTTGFSGSSGGGSCGTCPTGGTCSCPPASCETCTPPAGHLACGTSGDSVCGGYCPALYSCRSLSYLITGGDTAYTAGCACVPDFPAQRPQFVPCYLASARTCGGSCIAQGDQCVYDPKYETCSCEPVIL